MGCGEGAAGTQHPRTDGVTCTLAASTRTSCSWHRSRVLQDVGPGGRRVKGSPGPCALTPRERERLAVSGAVGRRLEGGEAGGTGVEQTELGAQEPGVRGTLEKVLGPDRGGELGGQHGGGSLSQGRSRGVLPLGSASRVFTPQRHRLAWPRPLSPHTLSPPEPLCHLPCGLEQVPDVSGPYPSRSKIAQERNPPSYTWKGTQWSRIPSLTWGGLTGDRVLGAPGLEACPAVGTQAHSLVHSFRQPFSSYCVPSTLVLAVEVAWLPQRDPFWPSGLGIQRTDLRWAQQPLSLHTSPGAAAFPRAALASPPHAA